MKDVGMSTRKFASILLVYFLALSSLLYYTIYLIVFYTCLYHFLCFKAAIIIVEVVLCTIDTIGYIVYSIYVCTIFMVLATITS